MASYIATLVISTSANCPTCKRFGGPDAQGKKQPGGLYDQLMGELRGIPRLNVITLFVPDMSMVSITKSANDYHPQLADFVKWFPTISLFNSTFQNKKSSLQGIVYSAYKTPKGLKPAGGLEEFNPRTVVTWVRRQLEINHLFAGSLTKTARPSTTSSVNTSKSNGKHVRAPYPVSHSDLNIPIVPAVPVAARAGKKTDLGRFFPVDYGNDDHRSW